MSFEIKKLMPRVKCEGTSCCSWLSKFTLSQIMFSFTESTASPTVLFLVKIDGEVFCTDRQVSSSAWFPAVYIGISYRATAKELLSHATVCSFVPIVNGLEMGERLLLGGDGRYPGNVVYQLICQTTTILCKNRYGTPWLNDCTIKVDPFYTPYLGT